MPRETLGYVRLEWTCPNCGTKNPGPQKTCSNCGGPQPENVTFEQAAEEALISDEKEIGKAKAGADIHCPYCGTRNPAEAEICSQCGGDLTGGKQRVSGVVVGAHRSGPAPEVSCARCGTMNPASAANCAKCGAPLGKIPQPAQAAPPVQTPARPTRKTSPLVLALIGIGLLICCVAGVALFSYLGQTKGVAGTVDRLAWARAVSIELYGPVAREGWQNDIPANAAVGTCQSRYHHTQNDPAPDSEKVCGTPYTVDKGSGYGEVVQDCEYRVYQQYCEYTVDDWQKVDEARLQGNDSNPLWPDPVLQNNQRLGERSEEYTITFSTPDGTKVYKTTNAELFSRCQLGTRWTLNTNRLGVIDSIEPAD